MVCTHERPRESGRGSCGKEGGERLRKWLKDKIRTEDLKGEIMAAKSSCLDVCPRLEGRTTVALLSARGAERQVFLVDREADAEALWALMKASLLDPA